LFTPITTVIELGVNAKFLMVIFVVLVAVAIGTENAIISPARTKKVTGTATMGLRMESTG